MKMYPVITFTAVKIAVSVTTFASAVIANTAIRYETAKIAWTTMYGAIMQNAYTIVSAVASMFKIYDSVTVHSKVLIV